MPKFKKNIFLLLEEKNNYVLQNINKKNFAKFLVRDDLDKALLALRQINSLQTKEGVSIYATHLAYGISIWSFHQQLFFLPVLTEYIKYEELICFLYNNRDEYKVILPAGSKKLKIYLEAAGVTVKVGQNLLNIINNLLRWAIKITAWFFACIITILAILKLWKNKPVFLIYTPDKYNKQSDGDFRVKAVYDHLRNKKYSYLEIFHTTFGVDFFKNLFKRRRLAIYLDVFYFLGRGRLEKKSVLNLKDFIEPSRSVMRFLLEELESKVQKSEKLIRVFLFLFKHSSLKKFISIDDPRYTQEILVSCKTCGIESVGFQHGHFTKYHVGWLNYGIPKELCVAFDTLYVWNEYWKKILVKYSSHYNATNVKIGGELRRPSDLSFGKKIEPRNVSNLTILVPYESLAPKEEIKLYIERFKTMGIRIYFKTRPDVNVKKQLLEYGLSSSEVKIVNVLDSKVLSEIDAAVGVYTTFLYEIIFYEKPVFILETTSVLGDDLLAEGLAVELAKEFEPEFLLHAINNNFKSKKQLAWPPAPKIQDVLNDIIKL